MLSRRDFLQVAAAAAVVPGPADLEHRLTQDNLLAFPPLGQVTLLHISDLHAQLSPIYFREPSTNIGIGDDSGRPPHLTGSDLLRRFGVPAGSRDAYALTSDDFVALAGRFGAIGGFDRLASVVRSVRAERPFQTLLLDGGDGLQGSYGALATRGGDMAKALRSLGVDATTAHWEFTYGAQRFTELKGELGAAMLCGNVTEATWGDAVFDHTAFFERGGCLVAVIGQAFPYTPIANPRWLIPDWSFGIREDLLRLHVAAGRTRGADLVVLLSHNGLDVDRKLAQRVAGIDVILSGHTHDALPVPIRVGETLLLASGSHGKFVARLDLDIRGKKIVAYRHRLIPLFADIIAADPVARGLVEDLRRPFRMATDRVLGHTDVLLYRRGTFNGTFDDLICDALLRERDAEIALSPGFRWGPTLLPGDAVRVEDVYAETAITYPWVYRREMDGVALRQMLEDVADNLFNVDPYKRQGGDMVRTGGLGYTIDISEPVGRRISNLTLLRTDQPIEDGKFYRVAGWGAVAAPASGPAIYDVVARYITDRGVVRTPSAAPIVVRP